jgi:glycosyltransferase involved in cell wall biosynthesis
MKDGTLAKGMRTLFPSAQRLIETPADLGLLDELCSESANWLLVERAPASIDIDRALDAFTMYLDRCEADARLLIVCAPASDHSRLEACVVERALSAHVKMFDGGDTSAVKAAYLCADALLCLEEADGFHASVIEALAVGTPIVAAAADETTALLDDAGLFWQRLEAALMCAAIERLRKDRALRALVRANGFRLLRSASFRAAFEASARNERR